MNQPVPWMPPVAMRHPCGENATEVRRGSSRALSPKSFRPVATSQTSAAPGPAVTNQRPSALKAAPLTTAS